MSYTQEQYAEAATTISQKTVPDHVQQEITNLVSSAGVSPEMVQHFMVVTSLTAMDRFLQQVVEEENALLERDQIISDMLNHIFPGESTTVERYKQILLERMQDIEDGNVNVTMSHAPSI